MAVNTYQKQFKRDVLWKPLLRLFRRYLKRGALPSQQYARIREKPIRMQGQLFAEALGMSKDLASSKRV